MRLKPQAKDVLTRSASVLNLLTDRAVNDAAIVSGITSSGRCPSNKNIDKSEKIDFNFCQVRIFNAKITDDNPIRSGRNSRLVKRRPRLSFQSERFSDERICLLPVFLLRAAENCRRRSEKNSIKSDKRGNKKIMNSLQEAKLNMYRAVETHCGDNAAVAASIPAFQAAFNDFKAKIAEIVAADQQHNAILTGITVDKGQLKQALCEQAATVAGAIYAFASVTQNNELKQQVNVSLSKLLKTSDNKLAARCRIIHEAGAANIDELADYGIKPALLTALQAAIDEYSANAPKPRAAVSHRKTITAALRALFREADTVLIERMDKLINLFRETHPDFADTYEAARRIIDPNTTTTQLKGIVTNKADAAPVKGASVTVVETGQTVKTDSAGEYSFKPLHSGQYTLRVTAPGFNDFEDDEVEVKLGEINHLDVKLAANS